MEPPTALAVVDSPPVKKPAKKRAKKKAHGPADAETPLQAGFDSRISDDEGAVPDDAQGGLQIGNPPPARRSVGGLMARQSMTTLPRTGKSVVIDVSAETAHALGVRPSQARMSRRTRLTVVPSTNDANAHCDFAVQLLVADFADDDIMVTNLSWEAGRQLVVDVNRRFARYCRGLTKTWDIQREALGVGGAAPTLAPDASALEIYELGLAARYGPSQASYMLDVFEILDPSDQLVSALAVAHAQPEPFEVALLNELFGQAHASGYTLATGPRGGLVAMTEADVASKFFRALAATAEFPAVRAALQAQLKYGAEQRGAFDPATALHRLGCWVAYERVLAQYLPQAEGGLGAATATVAVDSHLVWNASYFSGDVRTIPDAHMRFPYLATYLYKLERLVKLRDGVYALKQVADDFTLAVESIYTVAAAADIASLSTSVAFERYLPLALGTALVHILFVTAILMDFVRGGGVTLPAALQESFNWEGVTPVSVGVAALGLYYTMRTLSLVGKSHNLLLVLRAAIRARALRAVLLSGFSWLITFLLRPLGRVAALYHIARAAARWTAASTFADRLQNIVLNSGQQIVVDLATPTQEVNGYAVEGVSMLLALIAGWELVLNLDIIVAGLAGNRKDVDLGHIAYQHAVMKALDRAGEELEDARYCDVAVRVALSFLGVVTALQGLTLALWAGLVVE